MLYIKRLTVEEIVTLEEMHKKHPRHLTRNRAHRILLSYQGYSVPEICAIYNVCRQTVSTLFHQWERDGLCGLVDRPGRGRPSILTEKQQIESAIPYTWQPIGKTIEIPSSTSKRLNVLGFVNRDCRFDSLVFEGSITSAVVVSAFNWFANQIKKPTILLLDNASIHTSKEFNRHIDQGIEPV